ncbi:hypothetical protein PanWU01x14_092410 [Parasponia andersonii]|uniref:Uncharacterized protein n=1 Tax=Parasponia andersonii TaxID=3476 RepID=A0A2P5D6L2_PARAD|nr:hypothetical protein PanWU01x14_092410 [Parasponia andersonii]
MRQHSAAAMNKKEKYNDQVKRHCYRKGTLFKVQSPKEKGENVEALNPERYFSQNKLPKHFS